MQRTVLLSFIIVNCSISTFCQQDTALYFKGAIKENRETFRRNIILHTITDNLSKPLTEDTEENWVDAFSAIELLHYRSPWTDSRVSKAFDSITNRTLFFQRALLEMAYAGYPTQFIKQATAIHRSIADAGIFAMSGEYLLLNNSLPLAEPGPESNKAQFSKNKRDQVIRRQFFSRIQNRGIKKFIPVSYVLDRNFLKNKIVLYSFQRRNRNYPGLALVRDSTGNFMVEEKGSVFSVPQLARSISNLPGYLTNGNTPQGIFRMYGFDTSKNYFIGPTANIQLTMPFETSLRHFFNDTTITDTMWTEAWYKKLLPPGLPNYSALYESFYAGQAGRTEIIAHGTTVDPAYYRSETYYPQTPTAGCLCTKELWSELNGKRLKSDQQRLVNALRKVGGADGYCVVIEIDDSQKPVTMDDLLPLLQSAGVN